MMLFIAVRWGHDDSPDGANGEDTNFIVRANSRDEAATIVDLYLEHSLRHNKVQPCCNIVVELGQDAGTGTEAAILHGPWYTYFHMNSPRDYTTWLREEFTENQWRDVKELYPPDGTPQ